MRVAGVDIGSLGGRAAARLPLARARLRRSALLARARERADDPGARRRPARARRGDAASGATTRADELLERVGLGARRDAHPRELSGGEQQRVALCAALAHRPRLLIADEPTGELDAATARDVFGLIAELVREDGGTALVVSHDPASTESADRVVHVRDGRVSDERLAGGGRDGAIVVGRGGWLRLPEDLLRAPGSTGARRRACEAGTVVVSADRGCRARTAARAGGAETPRPHARRGERGARGARAATELRLDDAARRR